MWWQMKQFFVLIQINQPTRCTSFTSLLLDVLCHSTCFRCLHAHHQELTTSLTASGFTLECGGSSIVSCSLTTNNAATTTVASGWLIYLKDILVSNKSINHMQQFLKFITWRLLVCTARHVSGVLTPIMRSSKTAVAASGFTVGLWW
jgi:hypothetical protein